LKIKDCKIYYEAKQNSEAKWFNASFSNVNPLTSAARRRIKR
jgi:hypothetical protein